MNPFTRYISRSLRERHLRRFITLWDQVEMLAIAHYRQKGTAPGDPARWKQARLGLLRLFPKFRERLQPHWADAKAGGAPAAADPFASILALETLEAVAGNWLALQTLPAAREALNRLVLEAQENRVE
jgi:hypothetical protein